MHTLVLSLMLASAVFANGQQPDKPPAPPAAAVDPNWQYIDAPPSHTSIYVKANARNMGCSLKSVEADSLTCTRAGDAALQGAERLLPALSASAQQPASPSPEGSDWQHVEALPPGTAIHVNAKFRAMSCTVKRVDAETLTCGQGKDIVFQRHEITSVKIFHRGRSTLIGTALGIGAGAAAGAAAGSSCTEQQKQSFLGCFQIFTRGDMAALAAGLGALVGAPIGYLTDFTRSTVYKAP